MNTKALTIRNPFGVADPLLNTSRIHSYFDSHIRGVQAFRCDGLARNSSSARTPRAFGAAVRARQTCGCMRRTTLCHVVRVLQLI